MARSTIFITPGCWRFNAIGGAVVEAFVAHFAVGEPIPQMPLFLTRENYVLVPLEAAYLAAWEDVPPQYQEALLGSA
ncbi:MAG TPA: hypothetical protein VN688_01335 [Gemmataceae bacterium]|nr:hypothetical protein [Gemmataceae bacterium]